MSSSRPAGQPPDLPGYAFVERLGSGGFAEVYKYTQLGLGRDVAVKVLHTGTDDRGTESFTSEANVMARLSNHPSIVSIFGADVTASGQPFLVMEYCPPPHLGDLTRDDPMPVPRALEITIQLAGAVATAHRLGILHRDIKPANVLLTEFGRAALTDFGISATTSTATEGGAVGVSVPWAPPEQLSSGSPTGPTADVWSLAATCWTLLVGRPPFRSVGGENSPLATSHRIRTQALPSTQRPDVPESLERVLRTAMAKEPSDRFDSAVELARSLQAVQAELHLPATAIDLREEIVARVREDADAGGTRMSAFVAIDPRGPAGAGATTGTADPVDGTVVRGPGTPGPAWTTDPTSVPTPAILAHPAAAPSPAATGAHPRADADRPGGPVQTGRSTAPVLVLGVVALVLAAVVVGSWVTGGVGSGTSGRSPEPTTAAVADPVAEAPPAPTDVVVTQAGPRLRVAWTNPDPRAGDRFGVRLQDPEEPRTWTYTTATETRVESAPGLICVQVQLVRGDGAASASVTRCPGGES